MNFEKLIPVFEPVFKKYWDNKWPRRTIRYTMITGEKPRDIRDILESTCMEIEAVGSTITEKEEDMDRRALECLRYVMGNVKYVRDINSHNKPEFWQEAPETFAIKKGDCEDGAILIMKIMEAAGIPSWRRKLCAGNVQGGGHAYCIFLNKHFEWQILDWCIVDNVYTKIDTPLGKKRISKLNIGDEVLSWNEKTGKIEPTKIIKLGKRNANDIYTIKYKMPSGYIKKVMCTGEHPWRVNNKWVFTKNLKINDEIYWANSRSLANMFQRKEQYKRTSERQTKNNIFTRLDVRKKLSKNNGMKNPEVVEKVYSKRLKKGYRSNPEKLLIKLFDDLNLPVRFVGDGSFWVSGKNPDFKVEGEKKVIEVTNYGYLNRDEKWARERIKHFNNYGFKCLVVFYDRAKLMNDKQEIISFVLNGLKIVSIKKNRQNLLWKNKREVWNMHCEPNNNYFVNGLLCHNCYWPIASIENFLKRVPQSKQEKYQSIWFTWNEEKSWNQHSTIIETL